MVLGRFDEKSILHFTYKKSLQNFRECLCRPLSESTWQTVVIIPKGGTVDFRGVVLFKVLWKDVTIPLNRRLMSAIKFHDVLHRFWADCGTGTDTLEDKLIQNITATRESVLFKVLLELQKAYDAVDQDRCLDIIAVYGVVPRTLRLIQTY